MLGLCTIVANWTARHSICSPSSDARPYQLEGRDFLAGRWHALLADEMRVGKTPQAILAAEQNRRTQHHRRLPAMPWPTGAGN